MPQPPTGNDLVNFIGTILSVVFPSLGIVVGLFSQSKRISIFVKFMLSIFSRVLQDTVERPDTLPSTNGNGAITQQATLLAFSEGSKRVDSVADDVSALRREISLGFQKVDTGILEFGEKVRIRMDGDLLTNSRKHEANAKEITNLKTDIRDIDNRVKELEDWRGSQ